MRIKQTCTNNPTRNKIIISTLEETCASLKHCPPLSSDATMAALEKERNNNHTEPFSGCGQNTSCIF
jgi:hypothetical protein